MDLIPEVQWESMYYIFVFCRILFLKFITFNIFISRLWGWSGVAGMATPPESPHAAFIRDTSLQYEDAIIPELDIYAIPSKEGNIFYN